MIVENTRNFDNVIDLARSEGLDGMKVHNIKPLKIFFAFFVGHGVTVLACKNEVYLLPKQLGEKVAKVHFPALGAAPSQRASELKIYP